VATHFPVADDMVECALDSVKEHCPWVVFDENNPDNSNLIWSFDLMVLKVFQVGTAKNPLANIEQYRAEVSDYTFGAVVPPNLQHKDLNPPKYWRYLYDSDGNIQYDENGDPIIIGDPYAQIDGSTEIPSCDDGTGEICNYREDGY
jgi:ribonuclease Z